MQKMLKRPPRTLREIAQEVEKRFYGVVSMTRDGPVFSMRRDDLPLVEGTPVFTVDSETPAGVLVKARIKAYENEGLDHVANLPRETT